MAFDSSVILLILEEINSRLAGSIVKDVRGGEEGFSLEFGKGLFLVFNLKEKDFCLFVGEDPLLPSKDIDFPFVLLLRKYLVGSRFVRGYQHEFDRVVFLDFDRLFPGKFLERKRLFVELMPKKLNAVLVNSDRQVIGSWRKKSFYEANFYIPPVSEKVNPLLYPQFSDYLFQSNLYQGMSKNLLSYLSSFPNPELGWDSWINSLKERRGSPTLFISRDGYPLDYWFLDYDFEGAHERRCFDSLSNLISFFLEERRKIEDEIERRRRKREEIEDRRRYLLKKREKLLEVISKEKEIRKLEILGETIFANLSSIPERSQKVKLVNPYTGEVEEIELDPSLTPALNAQRYFKLASKLKRGIAKAKEELQEVEKELLNLEHKEVSAPLIEKKEGSEKEEGKEPYREFEFRGWKILVGKGASSNEVLTFNVASDDDIWLHAKGSPGSHVIIRNPSRSEVPQEVLEFAASLAAYYSKAKMNAKVPVDYTLVKYVKRHPAGKKGTVLIRNQRTIWVRPRSGEIS